MSLNTATAQFLGWLWATLRELARIDRTAAIVSIGASIGAHVSSVLTFMLPLKVVLLVGSDRVPRYFQFFVTEDTRSMWIGVLAGATFVFYVAWVGLESLGERYAVRGADRLRRSAGQVPLADDEESWTEGHYRTLTEAAGKLVFSALALLGGLLIYPALFGFAAALVAVEFAVVAFLVRRGGHDRSGGATAYVLEQPKEFLKNLQAVNFLGVFLFLVIAFMALDGVNILVAIVSIILTRQLFKGLADFVNDALELTDDRDEISALVFADRQLRPRGHSNGEVLLRSFTPEQRLERLGRLAESPQGDRRLAKVRKSVWIDTGTSRVLAFELYARSSDEKREPAFREYLYTPKAARGLAYEDYLVARLGPDELRSMPRVAEYVEEGYHGRIVEWRGAVRFDSEEWQDARRKLLRHFWALELPRGLVDAYTRARPLLGARFEEQTLESLETAADEPWAREAYVGLRDALPDMREQVAKLPLMLVNGRLRRDNIVRERQSGRPARLIDWRSWSLEPVGAGFDLDVDGLDWLVEAGAELRGLGRVPEGTGLAALVSASTLYRVEELVRGGKPKTGLRLAEQALPLLGLRDEEFPVGDERPGTKHPDVADDLDSDEDASEGESIEREATRAGSAPS